MRLKEAASVVLVLEAEGVKSCLSARQSQEDGRLYQVADLIH